MEIPEVPMWDPRAEFIDKLRQTSPLILVAFIVGNLAAWIYWISYVTFYKFVKYLCLRLKKHNRRVRSDVELDNLGQEPTTSTNAFQPNNDDIDFSEATEEDIDTVSMRSAKSGESSKSDLQSLRTAVGGHGSDGTSPDPSNAIRIRSVSNTSTYI